MNDGRARDKLYKIARAAESMDLRLYAIRRLGDNNDAQTIDQLIGLYDAEQDVQVKAMLIRTFGESAQKNAIHKLISIARDSQAAISQLAVRMLGRVDPGAEVLEELMLATYALRRLARGLIGSRFTVVRP